MEIYSGKGVFPGISFGTLYLMQKADVSVDKSAAPDSDFEWEMFEQAKKQADNELSGLFEKTRIGMGEAEAMIIDVQRMILEDGDFNEAVEEYIKRDKKRAACAVESAGSDFYEFFAGLDDPTMKARATDVADVSGRIVGILLGKNDETHLNVPSVIVADDLTPSETLQLDKTLIRAFVIRRGSASSHTAILARSLNIPSIVQANIPLDASLNGKAVVVDGREGKIYIDPDAETTKNMCSLQEKDLAEKQCLDVMRGQPSVTKDGHSIQLFANIGSDGDLEATLAADAEGIGLFRSEFLYLGRDDFPDETVQFEAYRRVAEGMDGRLVTIRTMDIGADKKVDYFNLEPEENPALGYRAIRICFSEPDMFKTQLRAIYRASAYGMIAIMFPMISSLWEVRRCKELAAAARAELVENGVPTGEVLLGIMIETPAAAIISDTLAEEVDFFSIGTNDLTQYTLAIDRQNQRLEPFLDTHHPAVMRLLKTVADNAHAAGIWVGICGELAADESLLRDFMEMGFDELSVSPGYILGMRKKIRDMDLSDDKNGGKQ